MEEGEIFVDKFKLPNKLFWDRNLSRAAKLVGSALYAYRNAFGICRKSGSELAELARISPDVISSAAQELQRAGYITISNSSYYSASKQHVVHGKHVYTCDLSVLQEGYTFLPRKVFRPRLTISQRLVYISLYVAAGNQHRAFPSINRLREMTGCARSTICKALQALRQLPELLIRRCQKRNRAFSSNSYHFCTVLQATVRAQKISSLYQSQRPAPISAPAHRILSAALKVWPYRGTSRVEKIQVTSRQVRGSPISRLLS